MAEKKTDDDKGPATFIEAVDKHAPQNKCTKTEAIDKCVTLYPELMTEDELVRFLRIDVISRAKDFHNVVENLKRARNLPCIHISKKCLYLRDAVLKWANERFNEVG